MQTSTCPTLVINNSYATSILLIISAIVLFSKIRAITIRFAMVMSKI